ncbi:MAG: RepB family plasmid replication initiator protein [Oxalobacteraceae bacterium]|nr:MAG: RepB family plasmid replication initiator protein [Oxalobacteraceae bacterium]
MSLISVSSAALTLRADKPLTPAMIATIWEIAAVLDEQRVPASVPNAVWLEVPATRLRGPGARSDNTWLSECLRRLTGIQLSGEHRSGEWGAVLVAEWHKIEGGSKVRILVPPAAVHALRSPSNFAKIEIEAAHRMPPHARRLYGLLADRKRQREPYAEWSVDALRSLLGVDDKRAYDVWAQFNKRVLTPALEAINAFGTVAVTMKPKKHGRSVSGVRFDWKWKDPLSAADTLAENERHSSARGREAPSPTNAPPLVEGDPVVRDGMARLVEGFAERMRVQE